MVSHCEKIIQIAFDKTVRPKMLIYFTVFINNFVKINLKRTQGCWMESDMIIILWKSLGEVTKVLGLVLGKKAIMHLWSLTTAACGRLWTSRSTSCHLWSYLWTLYTERSSYTICGEKIHGSLHPLSFPVELYRKIKDLLCPYQYNSKSSQNIPLFLKEKIISYLLGFKYWRLLCYAYSLAQRLWSQSLVGSGQASQLRILNWENKCSSPALTWYAGSSLSASLSGSMLGEKYSSGS